MTVCTVIRSLHDGVQAEVTVDGQVAPKFEVCNGLRQGCVIAPTLFNLYFTLVMEQWRVECSEFGVDVLYKCERKLVGKRTRRTSHIRVTELLFADDAVAVGFNRGSMGHAAAELERIINGWGLTLSAVKTKLLVAGAPRTEEELRTLVLQGEEIEWVGYFKYLGSVLEAKGGIVKDVGERIAKASRAFGALKKPVFKNSNPSYRTKRLVYRAIVLGVLLYGSETWTTKHNTTKKLEAFRNRCLRSIMSITSAQQRMGHISSVQVAKNFGMVESLEDVVTTRRLR